MKALKVILAYLFILFGCALLLSVPARAQTFNLSESSPYTAARVGINVGYNDYYQDYLLKNLTSGINPGFQPAEYAQTISVMTSGSTTQFTGGDSSDQVTANWWSSNGGTFFVPAGGGSNAGCSGTITANSTAGGNGVTYTIMPACPHAFAQFDVVDIKAPPQATTSNLGWTLSTSSSTITADTTSGDLPSIDGFSPFQVLKIVNSGGGSSASVEMNFDTSSGILYWNAGTSTLTQSLMIDVLSGSPTFTFAAARESSGGFSCSHTVSPSGGWNTYSTTCPVTEPTTQAPGFIAITYTMSGTGTALIVNSSLTSSIDNNSSAFRNQLTSDFDTMNVGECRFWEQQNGVSLNNWITPQGFRSPANGSAGVPYITYTAVPVTGLHDDLAMAAAHCGGQVWIEVPLPFSSTDWSNLMDYLGGGSGTTYGAKRIALGQTTPWTSVFSRIVLEVGNEVWNQAAQNQNIPYGGGGSTGWTYIPMLVDVCATVKGSASYVSGVEKCAGGFQTGSAYYAGQLEAYDTGHKVDVQSNNEYGGWTQTTVTGNDPWISASTEAWGAANGCAQSNQYCVTFAQAPQTGQYEWQHGDLASPTGFTQSTVNGFGEGEGYAAMVDAIAPLWVGQKWGALDHDFFTYSQPNFSGPTGLTENIWGIKSGVGGAYNNPRPSYYAEEIDNNCIGFAGTGWPVSGSSIPTYNFSGYNNVPAQSSVPYLQGFEFEPSSSTRCLLVANVDPAASHTFSVSGTNAPSGTVTVVTLTASSLTANNEGANAALTVQPATTTVNNPTSFTLAAHSVESISWSTGAFTPAPITITGSSITITIQGNITIP